MGVKSGRKSFLANIDRQMIGKALNICKSVLELYNWHWDKGVGGQTDVLFFFKKNR